MARRLYSLLLWLLLPVLPLRLLWRGRKQPAYLRHIGERFGIFHTVSKQPLIWVHAVSVGETRAAAPLIRALQQRYPGHTILLTHMTPTGRETGQQLFADAIPAHIIQAYLPYDFVFAGKRFLQYFRPTIGLLLETELWPNLAYVCQQQGIPLLQVNARLSERSARRYQTAAALIRPTLQRLAGVVAQTPADAQRLAALGASNIVISGNLKFDITPPPEQIQKGHHWRQSFGHRPVLLAASTREGEEQLILDIYARLANPATLLILVPRHPQRFDEVAELLQRRQLRFQRRSQSVEPPADCQVWLGDSMGELYAYYAASDAAIIGGSLLPYGGQNLIEACAAGTPVLVGPHTENFAAVAADAIAAGAAIRVNTAEEWGNELDRLLENSHKRLLMAEAGKTFARQHRGATQRTLEFLQRFI